MSQIWLEFSKENSFLLCFGNLHKLGL
jgi:hypothetical protein